MMNCYQDEIVSLKDLKEQQKNWNFIKKEKFSIKDNIHTMKENIETTRRRLQNRRVDDVSKFDYILRDNL